MKVKLNTSWLDCVSNSEIICPYCGHEQRNSRENAPEEDNENVQCGACDREFYVSRWVDITYTSIPNDKRQSNWMSGTVSEDGIDNMEDEDWSNRNGDKYCEVVG